MQHTLQTMPRPPAEPGSGAQPRPPAEPHSDAEPPPRSWRRTPLRMLLLVAGLGWVPWAIARLIDLDRLGWWVPAAQAVTPYVIVATLAVALIAMLSRTWAAAAAAGLGVLIVGAPVAGRLRADPQPAVPGGTPMTILTLNLDQGRADPEQIVQLVRQQRADVAVFPELTPSAVRDLAEAGMLELLPEFGARADERSRGLGVYARTPAPTPGVDERDDARVRRHTGLLGETIGVRGIQVRIQALHPVPPRPKTSDTYEAVDALTRVTSADEIGVPVIAAGDFNATLDNHRLRQLLQRGFRDAADETGNGLTPTWVGFHGLAALTIDHVLVSPGVAVGRVDVRKVRGTDHRAVIARLTLPAAG